MGIEGGIVIMLTRMDFGYDTIKVDGVVWMIISSQDLFFSVFDDDFTLLILEWCEDEIAQGMEMC